jgi:TPP-dependent 2-oxoacid decarboxylase
VGDGSFEVTAHELSTILRHDHRPVIFLINNVATRSIALHELKRFDEDGALSFTTLPADRCVSSLSTSDSYIYR